MFIHMQIDILDILFINFPFAQCEKSVTELLISPRLRLVCANKDLYSYHCNKGKCSHDPVVRLEDGIHSFVGSNPGRNPNNG